MNEDVMVVARAELAPYIDGHSFDFIRTRIDGIIDVIASRHFFIARATAETSPQYKQIIPYVVIRHGHSYFLLKRTTKQTEARLHHKLSLGIGGHINPDTPTILGGLQKELDEEVSIARPYELRFEGILNDDTTDVGRVHLGAVYVLEAFTPQVVVRETEKMTGAWTPGEHLTAQREAMETWSQLVYDGLIAPG